MRRTLTNTFTFSKAQYRLSTVNPYPSTGSVRHFHLVDLDYDVTVRDPVIYTFGATLLAIVALAACILPALRSTRVLPMVALRHE